MQRHKTLDRSIYSGLGSSLSLALLLVLMSVGMAQKSAAQPSEADIKQRIAVLDFRDEAAIAPFERALLADSVRGAALSAPFDVMTRENISALLPPEITLEDCVGECEVDVGRKIGAHYIVTGVIGRISGELSLLLRLYETRLGTLKAQAEARATLVGALQPKARQAASRLFAQLAPTQSASVKTLLWVKVSPEGAALSLDGFPLDPAQARPVRGASGGRLWPISAGRHLIKASAPGYLAERRSLEVIEGQPVEALFKLKRRAGAERCRGSACLGDVWIYTKPPNAEVSVLGETKRYLARPNSLNPRLGSVALRLPEGRHWVRAELGGRRAERLITVRRGEANLEMRDKPMSLRRSSAHLSLNTQPRGALVRLNGEVIGKTPIKKRRLKPGAYWLEVVAEGRQAREKLITLSDKQHWRESWTLITNTATLSLRVSFGTDPVSGASVWLSGQRLGETDREGLLEVSAAPIGQQQLEVRHPHYIPHQRSLRLKAGERFAERVKLEGAWAELSVNLNSQGLQELKRRYREQTGRELSFKALWAGQELGELPVERARVMAGRRWLQVRPSDEQLFEPSREQISLEVGAHGEQRVSLKPLKGDIDLLSTPPNARVSLDGEPLGKTPYQGRLETGLHELKMEVDGFPPYQRTILVRADGFREALKFKERTFVQVSCDPGRGQVTLNGALLGPSPQLRDLKPGPHEVGCQLFGATVSAPIQLSPGEQLSQRLVLSSASINFARWRKRWTPRIGQGMIGLGAVALLSATLLWLGPQRGAEQERDALAQRWLEARSSDELAERYRAWSEASQEAQRYQSWAQAGLWGGLSLGAGGGLLWWGGAPREAQAQP